MSSPFVAEIRIFAGSFAPTGWAQTNGQLLPLSQNTALFALLGTYYGGDGKSTFALPNLQGSVALGAGQSNTGTIYDLGQMSGSPQVTLLESEMPFHNHGLMAQNFVGSDNVPTANDLSRGSSVNAYAAAGGALGQMAFQALSPTGGSLPHNNMMPYLTLNYVIALQGIFPPRT